jgi:hypothetical protein
VAEDRCIGFNSRMSAMSSVRENGVLCSIAVAVVLRKSIVIVSLGSVAAAEAPGAPAAMVTVGRDSLSANGGCGVMLA